ncbi:hypothetical protein [Streptomyces sp. SHP 1-2]|uniref:hypothetical protein n=1 Tax=Streptomyces sp. SHP 1-2 TaxID=2769489 RepID=UPI002237B820|nr:hypothetical protein [Streptomyces sp. SHP 1-2]MCW5249731.1 hypothetical protein [Streptomyces sp. SHP 1-2]
MISTRRIAVAVGLAAGVTGLVAPTANAAGGAAGGGLSPMRALDSLAMGDLPAEGRAQLPRPSAQLNRLNDVNQLRQVTGLVSPVFGVVPAVQT